MQLFIKVDGQLELNVIEIALIKEFNNILVHSDRCDSDPTGQKKHFAYMKFNYIYHTCDYKSYPNQQGHSNAEAHKFAVDVSGLPLDWKPDDATKACMVRYKKIRYSSAQELNKELLVTMHTSSKLVGKINKSLTKKLDKDDLTDDDITNITTQHFKVIEIGRKIPEQIEAINKMNKQIDDEAGKTEKVRGGEDIIESLKPDNAIENNTYVED